MKLSTAIFTCAIIFTSFQAHSRDNKHYLPIQEALDSADFQSRLNPEISLYFGDQKHSTVIKSMGTFTSNKKTNAFGKDVTEACQWVLLSTVIALQERAIASGGNAVVGISSYYNKVKFSSSTQYECHKGFLMAGVALQGKVVKLAK